MVNIIKILSCQYLIVSIILTIQGRFIKPQITTNPLIAKEKEII